MSSSANTAEITCPRCKGDGRVAAQSSHGKGHKLGQCYRKIDPGIPGLWPDVKDYGQKTDLAGNKVQQSYFLLPGSDELVAPGKESDFNKKLITKWMLENAMQSALRSDGEWIADIKQLPSWKGLSMWNGQTVPAYEKEIVAEFSVLNYEKDGNPKGPPLRLQFLRKIHLSELTSCVHGRQSCLNDRTEMLEALNLVLMKTAVSGQSSPAFQTGKYKMKLVLPSDTTKPKLGMGHVLLNMSTGATMFHKSMTIAKYLAAAGQFQGAKAQAKDDLRGVTVYVNFDRFSAARGDMDHGIDDPPRRIKTISGFADELAGGCTFTDSGGVTRSGYQHMQYMFSGTSKCTASSVLLNVGGKSHGKQRYYAAEDLTILPYQPYKRKLDSFLTSAMIKKAERHPHDNITAVVTEGFKLLGIEANRAPPSALATAGSRVAPKMLSVPAYVAASPTIRYRCNEGIEVANGSWKVVPETHRLLRTRDGFCGQPFLIHVSDKKSQLDHATRSEVFKRLPSLLATGGLDGMRDFDLDKNFASVKGFDCSVKTFTGNDAENQRRYANSKIAADQYEGITSMCLNEQKILSSMNICGLTATGPFGNYARNVGMKLNMWLGGTNHCITSKVLDLEKLRTNKGEPDTIILGADVTHQSGGSAEHTPSIAAVLLFGFHSLLEKKTEIIDRSIIIKMVKERLRSWSEQNGGHSPTNTIYYRDGVGDSLYDQVLAEVDAIVPAWQKNAKDQSKKHQSQSWDKKNQKKDQGRQEESREPKITSIVATKRHNTRLFPTTQGDENATKTGNVLPGTIVESTITSPHYQDFYLVSHHSLKGTARPAHYFVLRNGIGLGIATIQQLSNDICYLYGRSMTSVSYATPAYYADRLCERGRVYLKEMFDGEKALEGKNEEETMEVAKQIFKRGDNEVGPWHKNLNETMFWM
ncbi:Piwi-domain-containing protein [Teratosphaeria destructans]|uniref:Piwi-domain-containing protein n=1 Tax=Teratosphaeria destructans TaxID=418781 RepID=A0A9W7W5K9_9PEZI|nr:Piwi-domain-containing protein [Teratosphaeria destructans]